MLFGDKIGIFFDYILISCVKSWKFYKHRISKIERREIIPTGTNIDIQDLKNDLELLIKKLVVFLPFKSTCIQRSLTIYRYLARKGIKADFMVGIRLAPYTFHCWLTYNGEIIFDSPADSKYYQTKAIKISEYFRKIPSSVNRVGSDIK